jgi:hypothetical protein
MMNAECRMQNEMRKSARLCFHSAFITLRLIRAESAGGLGKSFIFTVLSAHWGGADCAAGGLKFARGFFRTSAVK